MGVLSEVYRLIAYFFYALVAYLIWSLIQSITIAFDRDLRKIPGPFLSAFTVIPLKIQILTGRRALYTHELHERYGPYVRIAPQDVAIADMEAVRTIHRIGSEFHKGPFYQGQSPKQFSDETAGVFGIRNNKFASPRRKLFLHAGSRGIVTEWEPQVVELASLAVQQMKADLKRTGSCDIMKWFIFMASDVTGSLAFGKPFGNTKHGKSNALINDIEAAMPIVGVRAEFPLFKPIMDNIPDWAPGSIMPLFKRFDGYAQGALDATRAAQAGNKRKTMFSRMVMDDEKDQMIPDHIILNEATNVIVAGTDTTALSLTYLIYAVLKHQEVKKKLLEELKTCPATPRWGDLEKLPYLHNVIYETFRLYPIIPGTLPRIVPVGGEKLGRYIIPARTQVHTQALTMQRDPKIFKDPLKFDPERWNKATADMKEHMLNFGGPSRLCVGQNVARMEIVHASSIFFRECPNVKLAPITTDESMEMVDFFVAKPKSGKCVIVQDEA